MILINGNWEQVNNLQDVIRVVGEYYNDELAKTMEGLIPEHTDDEYYDLESQLSDKDFEISTLEDDISYKDGELDRQDEEIEDLKKEISKLEDKIAELESANED